MHRCIVAALYVCIMVFKMFLIKESFCAAIPILIPVLVIHPSLHCVTHNHTRTICLQCIKTATSILLLSFLINIYTEEQCLLFFCVDPAY